LMATSRLSMAAPQVAASRLSMAAPRGVDLSLDQFNLSSADRGSWAGTLEAPEGAHDFSLNGDHFWSALQEESQQIFDPEHQHLFKAVFNTHLSDRREEGSLFMPPPTSLSYLHKLKVLVKEETEMQVKRKTHFFSSDFDIDDVGSLFPSSWAASVKIEHERRAVPSIRARPDFKAQEALMGEVLKSAVPIFDKRTEDGTSFLIYRLGSLEIRATQDLGGKPVVGAVFSCGGGENDHESVAQDFERVVKATQYVEKAASGRLRCRMYLVFETEFGNKIFTEKLLDGTVVVNENPQNGDDRNSLARVLSSSTAARLTVGDVRAFARSESKGVLSPSLCKDYARRAYERALMA